MILLRPDGELKRPDRQKDTWQASMCCTQRQIRQRKRKCVEGQIAHNCTQRKREREREREERNEWLAKGHTASKCCVVHIDI